MRVAGYQAPLLPCGSKEAVELIRKRVECSEAEGVETLCSPEAVLGGLADYTARFVSVCPVRCHLEGPSR